VAIDTSFLISGQILPNIGKKVNTLVGKWMTEPEEFREEPTTAEVEQELSVRDRLVQLVEASGMPPITIARRLGEGKNWVYNRLSGTTDIKADDIPRFAKVLGYPVTAFFEDPSTPVPAPSRPLRHRKEVPPATGLDITEEQPYTAPGMTPEAARLAGEMTRATEEMAAASGLTAEDLEATWRVLSLLDRILRRLPEPPEQTQDRAG
jgi:transcriptional regulator with XRE-family HTH domain